MLTNDLEEARIAGHGISVHLTHVPAPVSFPRIPDVKGPGAVPVRHANPVVLCNNVVRYCQDRLRVDSQPRDL